MSDGYELFFDQSFGSHWDTDNANILVSGLVASENIGAAAFVEPAPCL
jgi:hypothetical protein